jgi:acyl-coenzyme A thioesterase 13
MSEKPEQPSYWDDISGIAGNASFQVKKQVATMYLELLTNKMSGRGFACNIGTRLILKEISFRKKVEEPQRMEGRVVVELTVNSGTTHRSRTWLSFYLTSLDMANSLGSMHGGCTAYLVDV